MEPQPETSTDDAAGAHIDEHVRERIAREIASIEAEHGVCVLYACESGSRAWGFASPDSDYDARFIYAHPVDWYLSVAVERKRDVIERPIEDDLDVNGWDLRKALGLLHKSNPPLLEWLGSPIQYLDRTNCRKTLQEAGAKCYSPIACAYHYKQMARRNFEAYLRGETVRLKKYLYVLRPVLAVRWIEAGRGLVPTEFGRLLEAGNLEGDVRADVDELLARKTAGGEMAEAPRLEYLHPWLESEMERLNAKQFDLESAQKNAVDLDDVFREVLRRAWSE